MMQETKRMDAKVYRRRHQRKKAWKNFVRIMACVVVFCTTYALILPAITQEKETFCGMEAHTHEDACYAETVSMVCDPKAETELPVLHTHDALCYREDALICSLAELEGHIHDETCYTIQVIPAHSHDETCMAQERGALVCLEEEQEGHAHTDACFAPGTNLICALEEKEGHAHAETCYQTENSLSCVLAEGEGHAHGEGCYSLEAQLACELPEGEEHTHEDSCYNQVQTLICTQPEVEPHTHGESCYTQVQTLICQLQEEEGHTHDDSCYELVKICELEEIEGHAHNDDCYEMVNNLTCTLEENSEEIIIKTLNCTLMELAPHTHGEGCYDANGEKVCTITEAVVHQHTEECIKISQEEALTCQLEEHEHTLECHSNPNADLETAADWEKTFADAERTGIWREDTLTIAKTQLGYHESTKNYIVEEDERVMGYSRYGAWYGIPYGDWCAMYASFCISYAGVDGMPLEASCPNWIQDLTRMNLYHSEQTYVPEPADLIFFDWNANGEADHVGLVAELDGEKVKTIEGNSGDSVAYQTYNLDDSRIMGYGALPVQNQEQEETVTFPCGMEEHTHAGSCYDEAGNLTCQLSEHTHSEECKNKQLFYTDETLKAFVTIKGVEELPQDLSVRVWQIDSEVEEETFDAMQTALIDQLATETQFVKESAYYGMELLSEGAVYELPASAEITVRVEFAEPLFTAEVIKEASEMGTYQMVPAESAISTFAAREVPEEEQTGETYLAESVTGESYDNSADGLTALDFQSNAITTFAVALTSELQEGIYWTRVTNKSQITANGTYIIVSAEGNYALRGQSSSNQKEVSVLSVKGHPEYYTISGSDTSELRWTITVNNNNYTIRSQATNNYLRLSNRTFISGTSGTNSLTYVTPENCWRINNSSYYLRNQGGAFTRSSESDGTFNYNNGPSTTQYNSRDMLIFKLSDVTELEIPADVVANPSGSDGVTNEVAKPNYGNFIEPSGSKHDDTAVVQKDANGNEIARVEGEYFSDPATSKLEINFRRDTYAENEKNDGKVMTDKSVIYGDDDYNAFSSYDPNTFSVTLSALGQEYELPYQYMVRTPVDVVYVLDVSGSMTTNSTGDNNDQDGRDASRAQAVTEAVNSSMKEILNQHPENRVGIVLYSSGAWEMLPLDRYTATKDEYLVCTPTTLTHQPTNYKPNVHMIKGSSSLKNDSGKSFANAGNNAMQGIGTFTQAGIAMGHKVFQDIGNDTTYTATMGEGDNVITQTVTRQPVFILLSDGEPTHSTNMYMDALNGPFYGDGKGTVDDDSGNAQGIHGYNTILSANYYKRMVAIQYEKPVLFYTIGMGINTPEEGDGPQVSGSDTGDNYKRAVLNPTVANITGLRSNVHGAVTATQLKNMMASTAQNPYGSQYITTANDWPDNWMGVPHEDVPVVRVNPYAGNYSYADNAYFGKLTADDLKSIFTGILQSSSQQMPYGFILFKNTSVDITDNIGEGMEIKGDPILRYNGKNYTHTSTTPGVDKDGNSTIKYTYAYEYKDPYIPDSTANLALIDVVITTYSDGKQKVYMNVPAEALPTYTPELTNKQNRFYYEALPVRLIYQVGLTKASEQAVLDLLENGGELTFYTNDFDYTDKVDNQGNHVTVVEPYASAVLNPSLANPFYHDQEQADGSIQKAQYKPHHDDKDENTTGTAGFHVDCQLASEVIDGTTVWEVTHDLGNNGKLVFSVESVDIPVEKTWIGVTPTQQDPVELTLYVVEKPASSETYIGTLVEGKTLTLRHSTDSAEDWKGTFTNLPKLPNGKFYAVAEAVPNGFVVSYGDNEISVSLGNGTAPIMATIVTDYSDEGIAATVNITNSPLVTLPETGGVGTTLYTTGGLLLMMAAVLLLLHNQMNKRRKGAESSR